MNGVPLRTFAHCHPRMHRSRKRTNGIGLVATIPITGRKVTARIVKDAGNVGDALPTDDGLDGGHEDGEYGRHACLEIPSRYPLDDEIYPHGQNGFTERRKCESREKRSEDQKGSLLPSVF